MTGRTLEQIAVAIGEVSPQWHEQLRDEPVDAPRVGDVAADARELAHGVELIYEGFALHAGRPRALGDAAPESIRLLVGDWCYAAGLRKVVATGDLDAVDELAALIADVSAGAANGDDDAVLETRWSNALERISLPSCPTPIKD
jgi:hypothetical protein